MPLKYVFTALLLAVAVPLTAASAQEETPEPEAAAATRGDLVYGSADAPVEIIEYGSMTCPHCGHFSRDVFPMLMENYIETGKVRFVFRNFVRDRVDMAISTISRCTSDEAAAKGLVAAYFTRQEEWMKAENPYAVIAEIAEAAGLSKEEMSACMSDRSLQEHLLEMRQAGVEAYQISGVPYLLLNGMPIKGHSYEELKAGIEAAL
jgi:protein-disulfide isomerase